MHRKLTKMNSFATASCSQRLGQYAHIVRKATVSGLHDVTAKILRGMHDTGSLTKLEGGIAYL